MFSLFTDKTAITSGENINFTGFYAPNALVNIFIEGYIRKHIAQAQCDSAGNFTVSAVITDIGVLQIGACSAGGLYLYECSLFPDKSNYLWITVNPQAAEPPARATSALVINLKPLSWADFSALEAHLPGITTAFAKAITLYGWSGWEVIESRIEQGSLVIYFYEEGAATLTMGPEAVAVLVPISLTTIVTALLWLGFFVVGYAFINLLGDYVAVKKTEAETEQLRTVTIADLCKTGQLTPQQCSEALKATEKCWISKPLGEGCLLSASTGQWIVGTALAALGLYITYWAVTRKPKETKIFIEKAKRAVGEEYERARAAYRELRAPGAA